MPPPPPIQKETQFTDIYPFVNFFILDFSGSYPPGYNQQSYNSSYQNHGGFAYNQGTGYNYGGGSYEGQSTGGRGSDQRTESYGQGNSGYPYPGDWHRRLD